MDKPKPEYIAQRELQKKIIMCLLFEEPFDTLVEEVKEPEKLIWAELRQMIAKNWVVAAEKDKATGRFRPTNYHDADDMRAFCYVATQKGLKEFKLR